MSNTHMYHANINYRNLLSLSLSLEEEEEEER